MTTNAEIVHNPHRQTRHNLCYSVLGSTRDLVLAGTTGAHFGHIQIARRIQADAMRIAENVLPALGGLASSFQIHLQNEVVQSHSRKQLPSLVMNKLSTEWSPVQTCQNLPSESKAWIRSLLRSAT